MRIEYFCQRFVCAQINASYTGVSGMSVRWPGEDSALPLQSNYYCNGKAVCISKGDVFVCFDENSM